MVFAVDLMGGVALIEIVGGVDSVGMLDPLLAKMAVVAAFHYVIADWTYDFLHGDSFLWGSELWWGGRGRWGEAAASQDAFFLGGDGLLLRRTLFLGGGGLLLRRTLFLGGDGLLLRRTPFLGGDGLLLRRTPFFGGKRAAASQDALFLGGGLLLRSVRSIPLRSISLTGFALWKKASKNLLLCKHNASF